MFKILNYVFYLNQNNVYIIDVNTRVQFKTNSLIYFYIIIKFGLLNSESVFNLIFLQFSDVFPCL